MIKFSKEKVLLLHQLIAQETGGSIGIRGEELKVHAFYGVNFFLVDCLTKRKARDRQSHACFRMLLLFS